MKITNNADLIESEEGGGGFDSTEAGISRDDQGYLFEVLSKRLYSNPIGTIVREITSNCFDSHVEAGVKKPVVIKFTYDENVSFISFIDYGVGLGPERMKKVFMNYFSSTKRNTNTQIGGFGLGSKSPLSYNNSFFIITQFDGIKYTYLMSQVKAVPTLDLLLEEECEPTENGTEIKIELKEHTDVEAFAKEIHDQLFYFDDVFVVDERSNKRNIYIDIDSLNTYKVLDFKTFKYRYEGNKKKNLHLVIDKVTYPIDFQQLGMREIAIPIAVKFEIGELEVTPSRESILYNENAKKIVKERIRNFFFELKEIYSKQYLLDDFKEWATSFHSYLENKSLRIQISDQVPNVLIKINEIENAKIDDEFLFKKHEIKEIFPIPQYKPFVDQNFIVNFNVFKFIEHYKNLREGKIEDNYRSSSTAIDLLLNVHSYKNTYIFDDISDRIKNRFLNSAKLMKSRPFIGFYKQWRMNVLPENSFKHIDLEKENKRTIGRKFYQLFIDEYAKNTGGYYSKVQLTQAFLDLLEKERLDRREEFKDKIKIETTTGSYMFEQKVTADYFDQFGLIVYSERNPDTMDRKLINTYSIFSKRISYLAKKNYNLNKLRAKKVDDKFLLKTGKHAPPKKEFKYVFVTSAKRNIDGLISRIPNAIHVDDFAKNIEKWEYDGKLAYWIGEHKLLGKLLRMVNLFNGINNQIHIELNEIKNFTNNLNAINYKLGDDKVHDFFKNHPIYLKCLNIIKYIEKLQMLNYIDIYSMDNFEFKTILIDYIKSMKLKINPSLYRKYEGYEIAMLTEAHDNMFSVEKINDIARVNDKLNYHPTIKDSILFIKHKNKNQSK